VALVGISLKENELWLAMKALGSQPNTGKWGRCLTLGHYGNGYPAYPAYGYPSYGHGSNSMSHCLCGPHPRA
jgi:hypothetical protein